MNSQFLKLHSQLTALLADIDRLRAAIISLSDKKNDKAHQDAEKRNMKRTKATAGEHETLDIKDIIEGINSKNTCGTRIAEAFRNKFSDSGCLLISARPRNGGNRGTHYDFEVLIRHPCGKEEWSRVEHKGSFKNIAIKADETPWSAGVQFHNGGCEKYSIAKKYARTWYDMYIVSGAFGAEFGLTKSAPTFEDWFRSDCKTQGDPKTEFGKELKKVVRAAGSADNKHLRLKRTAVNDALNITAEDIEVLKKEVLQIANVALEQKDYWLTIRGDVKGDFVCAWYPKFLVTGIDEIIVTKKLDIELEFRCNDNFVFHGILRWRKGAGFSNLRLDLK